MKNNNLFDLTMLHGYKKMKSELGKPDLRIWEYLNYKADFELAFVFSKLFWPDFMQVDGCILLVEQYDPKSFEMWKQKFNGDCKKIESIINHIHIYDLFLNCETEGFDITLLENLGQILLKCWGCALRELFPDKQFHFQYSTEPEEYGPTISFYHE